MYMHIYIYIYTYKGLRFKGQGSRVGIWVPALGPIFGSLYDDMLVSINKHSF